MVRSCHVRVGHGAHAIVRNVLTVVQVVREDVRSLPWPFVYRKMFVNIRCRIHSLYKGRTWKEKHGRKNMEGRTWKEEHGRKNMEGRTWKEERKRFFSLFVEVLVECIELGLV